MIPYLSESWYPLCMPIFLFYFCFVFCCPSSMTDSGILHTSLCLLIICICMKVRRFINLWQFITLLSMKRKPAVSHRMQDDKLFGPSLINEWSKSYISCQNSEVISSIKTISVLAHQFFSIWLLFNHYCTHPVCLSVCLFPIPWYLFMSNKNPNSR